MLAMPHAEKAREVALRKIANRRGLRVERSRRRDPLAQGWGLYRVVDAETDQVVAGDGPGGYALDLDGVQTILDRGRRR